MISCQYMQEEVLFMGQEENDLGNDLISQALTFRDQVNNNFSQKSSIKRVPIKLRFMYFISHSWSFHAQPDYSQSWFSDFIEERLFGVVLKKSSGTACPNTKFLP